MFFFFLDGRGARIQKKTKTRIEARKEKRKTRTREHKFLKDVDEASKSQNIKRRVKRVKNKKKG